jgi:hypothetical protein
VAGHVERELGPALLRLPHRQARPILRMVRILQGKSPGYWDTVGRRRFQRELRADGLDAAQIGEVVDIVDRALGLVEDVSLDDVLDELRRREGVS